MIIAQIVGGLGNQMFQYAAARAVTYRNETILKLDISSFQKYGLRTYQLGCFNIIEDFALPVEIKKFKPEKKLSYNYIDNRVRAKLLPWYAQKIIRERGHSFNVDIHKVGGNAYLEGYWQSEKYFKDIAAIIRSDFSFKDGPTGKNRTLLSEIDSTNSVSLHIRRGDYLTNPQTFKVHGIVELDYYQRSLKFLTEQVKNPVVFVFSDDISWAKQNLKSNLSLIFVDHNGANEEYEDLRLISRCRHHIIANSTFSWWGAWLNDNQEKMVIAPNKWFRSNDINDRDLIPESWVRI